MCGASYRVILVGKNLIDKNIKFDIEVSNKLKYRKSLLSKEFLFLVISQSTQNVDTLEILKVSKKVGLKTFALYNVNNFSIVCEANKTIFFRTGIEKGEVFIKIFVTQVMTFWIFANNLDEKNKYDAINKVIGAIKEGISKYKKNKRLLKRYLNEQGYYFVIRRNIFYLFVLENILKLKEISYIGAKDDSAGDIKHRAIVLALIELIVITLLFNYIFFEKTKSNIEKLVICEAMTLTIESEYIEMTDDFININETNHLMVEFLKIILINYFLILELPGIIGNEYIYPKELS